MVGWRARQGNASHCLYCFLGQAFPKIPWAWVCMSMKDVRARTVTLWKPRDARKVLSLYSVGGWHHVGHQNSLLTDNKAAGKDGLLATAFLLTILYRNMIKPLN